MVGRPAVFIIGNIITRSLLSPLPLLSIVSTCHEMEITSHLSPLTSHNNLHQANHNRKSFLFQNSFAREKNIFLTERLEDISSELGWYWLVLAGTWLGTSNSDIKWKGKSFHI